MIQAHKMRKEAKKAAQMELLEMKMIPAKRKNKKHLCKSLEVCFSLDAVGAKTKLPRNE